MRKIGAERATGVERASDDAGREMSGTTVGGACTEKPAHIAGTVDTGRVGATVVAEWNERRCVATTETTGEATETGSAEGDGKMS